jgi:hypothetical protein
MYYCTCQESRSLLYASQTLHLVLYIQNFSDPP